MARNMYSELIKTFTKCKIPYEIVPLSEAIKVNQIGLKKGIVGLDIVQVAKIQKIDLEKETCLKVNLYAKGKFTLYIWRESKKGNHEVFHYYLIDSVECEETTEFDSNTLAGIIRELLKNELLDFRKLEKWAFDWAMGY